MDILNGLTDAFNLYNIFFVAIGITLGQMVGAVPGLNGPMAIALAVPMTFYMPTVGAIGFLIGINKGGSFGGSISAILLNTPGSPEAVATTLDGYPLHKQGKSEKAIKMALYASVFGDTFSNLLLILVAAPIAAVAIKMGPAEICALIIFSLTIIASLESTALGKGLLAACWGLLISMIGLDPVSSLPRLTFGFYQLEVGVSVMLMGIGMLAMAELITQAEQTQHTYNNKAVIRSKGAQKEATSVSWKEFKGVLPTLFRSSLIGSAIGAMPGLGSTVAAFLGYGAAKKYSKDGNRFGTGVLEGVAAPEAANNAVIGANLIPLFTLGIPGNICAALLIGAFVIHGVTPGPLLFEEQGRLVYGIYGTMLIGNVCNLIIGYFGLRLFVKLLSVPQKMLYPVIMLVCLTGAYISSGNLFSVSLMLMFTCLGFIMKNLQFSFVTFIIGFVLGPMFELSLQQVVIMGQGSPVLLFTRPIAAFFMFLTCLTLVLSVRRNFKKNKLDSNP